jgi:hypothetical protein
MATDVDLPGAGLQGQLQGMPSVTLSLTADRPFGNSGMSPRSSG